MKKRYLAFIVLLLSVGIINTKALVIDDCKVLASYKLYSSLDEESYICKGKEYESSTDSIYYSGEGEDIYLNNFEGYYFSNYDENINLNIKGDSNIFLLHLSDTKLKISGTGSLKFKENSFVKKVINGESVYQYIYNDKPVLDKDKKIYEGIVKEFEENYDSLKEINNLPEEYNVADYSLNQAIDYTKMVSVPVTELWLKNHIETNLSTKTEDGFGIVKYVKEETKKVVNETKLESENVILISDEKVDKKYKLNEKDLKNEEIADKINNSIDEDLISLYDVTVFNGSKEVSMKDGNYIIKIKLDESKDMYEDYRIIYVNDDGEIEEYIDGTIEGDYIVFETTHLSQYGVIGNYKTETVSVNKKSNRHIIGNAIKISIIGGFIAVSSIIITFLLYKNKVFKTKKSKKRRA